MLPLPLTPCFWTTTMATETPMMTADWRSSGDSKLLVMSPRIKTTPFRISFPLSLKYTPDLT
ncbi:hypothetical protein TIFTF001_026967 [Ficus carica]|uniref:Uncharacterized protein n=1 Tax=Ficus carica TaxID=3494 RepID=A0AA88IZI9_FICCA|nr:hypothetical protein TIFTF001_026967 [Ficus carica]